MPRQNLIGTDLDAISTSTLKYPAYKVLLFDPYQDTVSDIVLDEYTQAPLDITAFVTEVQITESHSAESNQASITVVGTELDYRLFMYSWVKVYEGDQRVIPDNWPCVFAGVFKGQPSRINERGQQQMFTHVAYDRSIYYLNSKITSRYAWRPEIDDGNLGAICVEIATNTEWGMGLDRREVLFGNFYRTNGEEWRINKKLQIVDIPSMEALTTIMQVARFAPAFNGEGKLVARPLTLDRNPIRVYPDNKLIQKVDIPQNVLDLPTSVTVIGQDYRMTRVDYKEQRLFQVQPLTLGMFETTYDKDIYYGEDENTYRAVLNPVAQSPEFQGQFLIDLFGQRPEYSITLTEVDDYTCHVHVYLDFIEEAILILVGMTIAYTVIEVMSDEMGEIIAPLGFAMKAGNQFLLLSVLETLRGIGMLTFEVWGTPFEYAYLDVEAKAYLSDTLREEEQATEIQNRILGTLTDCEDLARDELKRLTAQIASRSIVIARDFLLEPNDIIELEEEDSNARYYIQEINKTLSRGAEPTYDLSCFRVR